MDVKLILRGVLLVMLVGGCSEGKNHSVQLQADDEVEPLSQSIDGADSFARSAKILCARRIESQPVCNVDFSRLAAFYPTIDELRMSITGYLVVDDNMLSLYATKEDYMNRIKGRSVEIRVEDEEALGMFSGLLYEVVNVEGIYSRDFRSNNVRGRLGFMSSPFEVYKVDPRSVDQGIDAVLFSAKVRARRDGDN